MSSFELDFAPSWARAEASVNIESSREQSTADDRGRSERPPRGASSDKGRDVRDNRHLRKQAPRHGKDRGAAAPSSRPNRDRPRREFVPRLPLEVRVLPEQKALGAIMRRIQTSHCAFPLRDLAALFLDKPASCQLRLEPLKGEELPLFQCKVCGMPALTEAEIHNHILSAHLCDFFTEEEVECPAPEGQFVCVAKCGLSGEYLGPPNHHSYGVKVREMLRTRFSSMSEEQYRSKIEMIRDPEAIEAWRQQCTHKKVYTRKLQSAEASDGVESKPMDREAAESIMVREIISSNIGHSRHVVCSLPVALKTPSRALFHSCNHAFNSEKNRPISLFFALRGAFRHRSLAIFRVNDARGPEFVQFAKPVVLDGGKTVPILHDILAFINENPGCTRQALIDKLASDGQVKSDEILLQLSWLVEKGHVVHFYNDTLSAPAENPYFNVSARSRAKSDSLENSPAEAPVVTEVVTDETPAAEAVQEEVSAPGEPADGNAPSQCDDGAQVPQTESPETE